MSDMYRRNKGYDVWSGVVTQHSSDSSFLAISSHVGHVHVHLNERSCGVQVVNEGRGGRRREGGRKVLVASATVERE